MLGDDVVGALAHFWCEHERKLELCVFRLSPSGVTELCLFPVFDAEEDTERAPKRERWVNLNAFVARLTAARVYDFELYAIWQLRDALEEPVEESGEEVTDSSFDAKIPAAVQWIFYCGELIYTSKREYEHGPRVGDPARGGELWKGDKRGFCEERWGFWKNRFAELQHYEKLLPETRALAGKAVQVMEGIEKKQHV